MIFSFWKEPSTLERHVHIVLSDRDVLEAYGKMTRYDRMELDYFGRADATVEEKLMALQVYARTLEPE